MRGPPNSVMVRVRVGSGASISAVNSWEYWQEECQVRGISRGMTRLRAVVSAKLAFDWECPALAAGP